MATLRDRVMAALARIDGVEIGPSMFGEGDAIWCNRKEIAHFDADDVVDIRLTRALIRARRTELRADERVTLRKHTSDWLEVCVTNADFDFVVELVTHAAGAHRLH